MGNHELGRFSHEIDPKFDEDRKQIVLREMIIVTFTWIS